MSTPSEKAGSGSKDFGIPVPASTHLTVNTPQTTRRRRVVVVVRCILALIFLCHVALWRNYTNHRKSSQDTGRLKRFGHNKHDHLRAKEIEELFLSIPNEESAIAASRQFASKPHLAGTPQDLATAQEFLTLLETHLSISTPSTPPIFPAGSSASRNATLSIPQLTSPAAWIDVYYPVMNTPLDRSLEILDDEGNVVWKADLEESSDETDPDAAKYAKEVKAWHGLSRGGEATGKLVYAHYGRKEDYDELVAKGVDLNGAIVITRYGGIFRGLKVKGAQELGAAAVLIYSDLRDDGTVTVENGYLSYPYGPARNPTSIQRGSVQFISIYPGDPTTPGYPSYENATRTEGSNIPGIPSLPISWKTAERLLEEVGEDGRRVKVVNNVDEKVTPIWNTMGVIPGHIKDEIVVLGNHRDAWVLGATDPTSGTASVHEVIRGFGELLQTGWKPMRTILLASWDAEEYGLIGSTEWGEDFTDFINEHVVAYVNLDSSASGSRLRAAASPSLAHLVAKAASDVPHPTSEGRTLWDARHDQGELYGENPSINDEVMSVFTMANEETKAQGVEPGVSPLGSGSDYTVFLQRIGVASSNGAFGPTLHDPVYHYHSVFDSERWQETYGDPGFFRHVAIAKYIGLQVLRLSDSLALPLNVTHYAHELELWLDKVENIASTQSIDVNLAALRDSIRALQKQANALDTEKVKAEKTIRHIIGKWKRRRSIRGRLRRVIKKVVRKFKKIFGTTQSEGCSSLEFGTSSRLKPRLGRYVGWLREQREKADNDMALNFAARFGINSDAESGLDSNKDASPWPHKFPVRKFKRAVRRLQAMNKKLVGFERGFISEDGIKDREWYKHLGVAPGKWLGYGATTLPALTEALTIERNGTLAEHEAGRLKDLIDALAERLKA